MCGVSASKVRHQNKWRKEQMANECVIMKVPKIKMEEDCWVIDGRRKTLESLGDISDIIGKNETVLRVHVPGHKGDRCKKKPKSKSWTQNTTGYQSTILD
jgi:hypothetical protein